MNLEEPTLPTVNTSLCYIQVTVEEISKLISSLDVHKALGWDNMPTVLLKECAESLAPFITAVPHVKNVLYPFQHGFQRGKSCVSQVLEVFQDIG